MFGDLMALPVLAVRAVAELALLIVALSVVVRVDRRAGLWIAAGGALELSTSIASPLAGMAGIGLVLWQARGLAPTPGAPPSSGFMTAMWATIIAGWIPYLVQAAGVSCVAAGIFFLARRIPAEERESGTGRGS